MDARTLTAQTEAERLLPCNQGCPPWGKLDGGHYESCPAHYRPAVAAALAAKDAEIKAAVDDEMERCAAIVMAARMGEIDQDFRAILYMIKSHRDVRPALSHTDKPEDGV